MINDLHQQGLSISAIARKVGCDRKTVKKYIERGLEAPCYGPRAARSTVLDPYTAYLTERVAAFPDLSGRRLLREIRKLGYEGSYSTLKPFLRDVRPPVRRQFERQFEAPAGQQAQVDFAEFSVAFTDEPGIARKVWLFSMVLGHSRWLWGRFVSSQNLQSVMRCHIAAFDAMGGSPEHILYGRMKTAVIGEEQPSFKPLPAIPYNAVLTVERRFSHEGMVSVAGNYYSVPDTTRKRVLEVQNHPHEVRIFEDGVLIASHPVLSGKNQRRVDPAHRKAPPPRTKLSPSAGIARRSLDFYGAVGERMAAQGAQQ